MTAPLVTWEHGVRVAGTPVWCDARHRQALCFVSSAAAWPARGHGEIVTTETTLRLATGPTGTEPPAAVTPPLASPFHLGNVRLELIRSGFMPGAASLLIEAGARRVLYAGPVGAEHEVRKADAVVLDASVPDVTTPADDTWRALLAWIDARPPTEGCVVFVDPWTIGPELARRLDDVPMRAHGDIARNFDALRAAGLDVPAVTRTRGRPSRGAVTLWPVFARPSDRQRGPAAIASAWAGDAAARERLGVKAEAAFALGDRLTGDELVGYASATGASQVYLTGGGEQLAGRLGAKVSHVERLGPPEQLHFFGPAT